MAGRTGYWQYSFRERDSFAERTRPGHAADQTAEQGGDPCSRDIRCSGRRIVTEGGERKIVPARTYGPFCPSCQGLIASCLAELPPAYVRLGEEIPEPHRRGITGHSPFGPRLPFDASFDLLQRAIAEVLASWHERVADVARLAGVDTQLSRRRDQAAAVAEHAQILGAHLTVLLALEHGPMMRSVPLRSHVDPDLVTMLVLSGRDAGDEILDLHRRSLLTLGEIVRQRETLDGVPCRKCEAMALERAEPPSDPSKEAMWSECRECRDLMPRSGFDAWAAMYARWAQGSGVECRRCQLGRHDECSYADCVCLAGEHIAALPAA
jgi:hypothetical protein